MAFKLFNEGKEPIFVAIELDISGEKAEKLWSQYLKLKGMYECYEFYQIWEYDLPTLLSVNNFMKKNNVHIKDISNVLSEAKTIANLQIHLFLIKNDIEKLNKIKHNYNSPQNNKHHQLKPLPKPINWNYQYGNNQF